MRLVIRHHIAWTWTASPRSVIEHLRIEPRNHEGQHTVFWRMDVQPDGVRRLGEDGFGNAFDSLTIDDSLSELSVSAEGEIETFDTNGIVRHAIERFPPELYLRTSSLTDTDAALRDFAERAVAREPELLGKAHALMDTIHETVDHAACHDDAFKGGAGTLAAGRGHSRDLAHLYLACARHLGIPARIAVGHLFREDGPEEAACLHGWAEAYVDGIGWIGFDPVTGRCPEGGHIRLAIGIDAIDTLAVRGAHHGGSGESVKHRIAVRLANGRTGS